ncbi:DUF6481 family protein [Sphingomonas sp.]|uniref:DUF6481 family protein n=1 Tax=Sphingomonas sp. TaxID=28214 RepID=UPI00286D3182|nr:DUF6481 family protein [Sphingomonas sp.]
MAAFKDPDFNTRTAAARAARQRALDRLRDKPVPDPAIVAARDEARVAREIVERQRRAARQNEAKEQKARAAQAKAEALKAAGEAADRPALSETELKALRDARYASRKARRR